MDLKFGDNFVKLGPDEQALALRQLGDVAKTTARWNAAQYIVGALALAACCTSCVVCYGGG